jgi:sigma-B regulation protein RsbU (phosphoserine phosphatase)
MNRDLEQIDFTRQSVLVVDDEAGMRYTARRILEPRYEVVDAATGEEAIDLLGERPFDIAVIDVRLPGLSGLELLATIKVISPSTDVVIMTGSVKDPDEALLRSLRSKAFFFLRKPFSAAVLETLVDRITETQTLEQRLQQHARRLEEDLESAKVFQRGLIPPREWKGNRIDVAGIYVPCEKLSGDLIDYWNLPNGQTALFAADVMGHGASAAMITGIVKTQVRTFASQQNDPARILEQLDSLLRGLSLQRFLTAMLVIDDPFAETIHYCGAGHPSGDLRMPDGKFLRLKSAGVPLNLGLPGHVERESVSIPRKVGSRLLLCTDGFTEAVAPTGQPFYESENFRKTIELALSHPPSIARGRIEEALLMHVQGRPQDDDRALLIAELL